MAKDKNDYVMVLVQAFLGFTLFVGGIVGAYFTGVGLYFGQSVVEGDVFTGAYKYTCNNANETAAECTNVSTTENTAYSNYATYTANLNTAVTKFLLATFIAFSLLGLYFLFLAIRGSGIMKGKDSGVKARY